MKVTPLFLSLVCATEAFQTPSRVSSKISSSKLSSSVVDDESMDDLKSIAAAANPVVNYFDPLDLVNAPIGNNKAETIAWLRHAEIKHGRVAMAAFVGYCVQAQGITWGFEGGPWAEASNSPEAQWDALGEDFKAWIIFTVGLLEFADEVDEKGHYLTGKKEPGRHPIFQRDTNKSAEVLAEGRIKEINNGRLAMLGIMGFVSASSVPGSVPVLNDKITAYAGNFWAPFQSDFQMFPTNEAGVAASAYIALFVGSVLWSARRNDE